MKFAIQVGKENGILRAKSEAVRMDEIRDFVRLADDMVKYVKDPDNGGVGLAAPQVGVNKRIIAVSLMRDYDDENYRTIAMINPEILEFGAETEIDQEGCLSVPGENGDVERSYAIKLHYLDTKGKEQTVILRSLAARIVQHEIDHLNGVLFTDRVIQREPVQKGRKTEVL